jgi:ferric-dicitrate binding protein FerR (iron transport regulator)
VNGHTEREEYYADFESDGEEETRRKVARGEWDSKGASYARDWLAAFDAERAAVRENEAISLARRATLAAEAAVDEARIANSEARRARRAAQIANAIAAAALIIATIALTDSIWPSFLP